MLAATTSDPAVHSPRSQRSRLRMWSYRLAALCLSVLLLEGFSSIVWWIDLAGIPLERVATRREQVITSNEPAIHPTEAIHPYLGWVLNPDLHPSQEIDSHLFAVNAYGYVDDGESRYKRSPDRFLLGIVGGSVAQQVSLLGESVIRKRLEAAPELQGRKIQFVRLALSGHKQPQQLMSLAYLLSQGGELDALVNVDGFNEVALTLTENALSGVALSYPRSWHHRLQDVVDPRVDSESYDLLRLKVYRRRAARFFDKPVLRDSPTCQLAWYTYDRWIERSIGALGNTIREHRNLHGHGFAKDGPEEDFKSDDEVSEEATRIWKDGSRQLDRLCRANGIRYLHVLQPNQYLKDSKPLSEVELKTCFAPEEAPGKAIARLYPTFREVGGALTAEGIDFHDATQLFAGLTETLYADYFCHYNQKGNDLLGEAVAGWILESIRKPVVPGAN